jgi:uncharacterized protein YjbI with pentapeptide repeats
MSHPNKQEFQMRWDEQSTASALDSLLKGTPTSPFGHYDGRVDLRGLVVEKSPRVPVSDGLARITQLREFDHVEVRDVDLSSSTVSDVRIFGSRFENCVFDNAKLPGYRTWSGVFERCSFKSTNLKDTMMGGPEMKDGKPWGPGSRYEDCDFSGADLRDISTEFGRFVRCSFQRSRWYMTQTLSAVFEQCDFREADVNQVRFDGRRFDKNGLVGLNDNKMMGCDFSTAKLYASSFLAIDCRNLIPPNGAQYVLIDAFPSKVRLALDRLKADGTENAKWLATLYEPEFRGSTVLPGDAVGMLDIGLLSDEEARLLAAVFEIER